MENPLELILLLLGLLSGAIAIFFAFRTMQAYKQAFTSNFFYYVVFLYIFGSYGLAGSGLMENLMYKMEASPQSIQSARMFSLLAGMPLMALAYYMWLRSLASVRDGRLSTSFTAAYLLLAFLAIGVYGYFALRMSWFEKGSYISLINIQWWVFAGLQLGIYTLGWLHNLISSRHLVEHHRAFSRNLASLYLLYGLVTSVSFVFSGLHLLLPYFFFFIFLAWHLVPTLYMHAYLQKYHGKTSKVEKGFEHLLDEFVRKHEISKREREVVLLISKGLSNQEISDSLFISLQTVKDHVHRIFVKTGVKSRIQLTNLIRSKH